MTIATLTVGALETNCYLVSHPNGDAALIDPGSEPEKIAARLEKDKLALRAILLTHGHFDHIAGVSALQERYGVPVYIHQGDAEMLADEEKSGGAGFGFRVPAVEGAEVLKDGEAVKAGALVFILVHTPGHSEGSSCYLIGEHLFTGDTLFCGGIGRTDLYGGSFSRILASLAKLAALPGDLQVYPGHGELSTLAAERAQNPYMGSGKP